MEGSHPRLQYEIDLTPYTTFGVPASAARFGEVQRVEDIPELIEASDKERTLVLGGGSNILFASDWDGLVLHNSIKGIEVREENGDEVLVDVGGGENWHEFVLFCVNRGLGGIENLSLIPGCVGAAPIQNIGAYGIELKDVFEELEAFDLFEHKAFIFKRKDCSFGYRDSVFKNEYKGRFLISRVTLRLSKKPVLNTSYGAIEDELERMGVTAPTIKEVSDAVINIRRSKLPDPQEVGNAGSFFKNPIVSQEQYENLKNEFPDIKAFPVEEGKIKLAAGWLIERTGWKGKRMNGHGVHPKQALVLVNYGGATGKDVLDLSERIQSAVRETFGVELQREVNVL